MSGSSEDSQVPTPETQPDSQATDEVATTAAAAQATVADNESNTPNSQEVERPPASGPLSLDKIRQMRMSQQATATANRPRQAGNGPEPKRGPQSHPSTDATAATQSQTTQSPTSAYADSDSSGAPRRQGNRPKPGRQGNAAIPTPEPIDRRPKIASPSTRQPLSQDLEQELNAALGNSDLDKLLVGDAMLQVGHELTEGQRMQGKVMKAHGEFVFISLGGANEAVIPALGFETVPEVGAQLDVIVRGYLADEGLYEVTVPGNAVDVSDWGDLNEGEVVEAMVTGANTGGLECKVGSIDGFIPASQAAEYRIENLADMVGQKILCVVTEANQRRGNLVLSHRAVLEREKKEKREERLANLEIGSAVEGVVRKILDFGAFVDIGGVDGLLHVSQLSWERVKHPSEILQEGQKIQVRIDKLDEQSGKISLSYRSLQDHPWENIDARFPTGALVHGTVTRIAEFGAFVRIATGVEGLIHVSELAHYRVHNVANVVQEGQEIDVKVLSVDEEQQRISLSLKAVTAAPEAAKELTSSEPEVEEPRPEPVLPKHRGPLKGGTGHAGSGEQFGLKW